MYWTKHNMQTCKKNVNLWVLVCIYAKICGSCKIREFDAKQKVAKNTLCRMLDWKDGSLVMQLDFQCLIGGSQPSVNSNYRRSDALFWLPLTSDMHMVNRHTGEKQSHKINNIFKVNIKQKKFCVGCCLCLFHPLNTQKFLNR